MFKRANASRLLQGILAVALLMALVIPGAMAMAGGPDPDIDYTAEDYPILFPDIIDSISSPFGTTCTEYNVMGVRTLDKDDELDGQIIDWTKVVFQKPADYVAPEAMGDPLYAIDYDGDPVYIVRDGKRCYMTDLWVFKIDYKNAAGEAMIDPWQYKEDNGATAFGTNPYCLELTADADGLDYDKFSVFYLDFVWDRDEDDRTFIEGTLNPIAGGFFNDLGLRSDFESYKSDRSIFFSDQWPMYYALAYFGAPPVEETASPIPSESPSPSPTSIPTASPTAAPTFPRGDVNLDGEVDIDDILAVRGHMFGTALLEGDYLAKAEELCTDTPPVIDIDVILAIRGIIFG